eukprot:9084814-Alexandrium_andersonii.AAC.1
MGHQCLEARVGAGPHVRCSPAEGGICQRQSQPALFALSREHVSRRTRCFPLAPHCLWSRLDV